VVKNKLAPPFREVEFDITYGEGVSREGSVVDLGVDAKVIENGEIRTEPRYLTDLWTEHGVQFIERNKDRPFFCYAAWTPPHDEWVIPDNTPFSKEPWPVEIKNYAAMVSLIDKDVGRLMEKLKDLGIDDNTLVIFSSDNGANDESIEPLGSTGELRGHKRMLYEGGIRAPFIARWPGKIEPVLTRDLGTRDPPAISNPFSAVCN
jgi:arylsulfatase A-like enzyme